MRFLLEKSLEHLESAGRERTAPTTARRDRHYLNAAECLFNAAAQSSGRLRAIRLQKAEQLVDIARRLEGASRLNIPFGDRKGDLRSGVSAGSETRAERWTRASAGKRSTVSRPKAASCSASRATCVSPTWPAWRTSRKRSGCG